MPTQENPLDLNFAETGGGLSPEAQAEQDAKIMEGLRTRRAAEAEAEAAAKPQEDAQADAVRNALNSFDWDTPEQQRRGFN